MKRGKEISEDFIVSFLSSVEFNDKQVNALVFCSFSQTIQILLACLKRGKEINESEDFIAILFHYEWNAVVNRWIDECMSYGFIFSGDSSLISGR